MPIGADGTKLVDLDLLKRNYTFELRYLTQVGETPASVPISLECCKLLVPDPPAEPPMRNQSMPNGPNNISVFWYESTYSGVVQIDSYEIEAYLAKREIESYEAADGGGAANYWFKNDGSPTADLNLVSQLSVDAGDPNGLRTTFYDLERGKIYVFRVR